PDRWQAQLHFDQPAYCITHLNFKRAKIYGTGERMSEKGRCVVVEGDLVLCPCKKNRVIVGSDPGIFLECESSSGAVARAASDRSHAAALQPKIALQEQPNHTQRVFVWDSSTGMPLADQRWIADVGGVQQSGTTDGGGYATIETKGAKSFKLHVVFNAPKRRLKPNTSDL
ncbi:hypothetical protein, partial [Paraburkholderia sp. UYCP14C]|uniref:hypothetical protein n=1 Tax=Paraburkholderia sp. UYCP14C TaxID=2511130 RepID=UPI001459FE6B